MKFGKESKIVKNASWIIGCKIVQSVLNLLISMITARYLGPSNYGLINYAMSITAFFAPLMNLGVSDILVNEILSHPDREEETLGTGIGMTMLSAALCVLGIGAFVSITDAGERDTLIVCVLYSLSLFAQSLELIRYWFQAKYLAKYTSLVMLAAYGIISLYRIYLLVANKNVYWFAVANGLDYLLIALVLLYYYKRISGKWLRFSLKRARSMFSVGRHYILSGMMVTIFAQTDRVMIKNMLGEVELGYYSAALTIAGMTSFVFAAIIDSMRPAILANKSKDKVKYEGYLKKLYSIIIYLALAQSVFATVFAGYMIAIMYGDAYAPSMAVLRIAVWYTLFSYIGAVRNIWILAEQKQRYLLPINLAGAVSNVVLNYLMIPCFGICGAAAATVSTQVFTNVIVGFLIKPIRYNNLLMWKSLNLKSFFDSSIQEIEQEASK